MPLEQRLSLKGQPLPLIFVESPLSLLILHLSQDQSVEYEAAFHQPPQLEYRKDGFPLEVLTVFAELQRNQKCDTQQQQTATWVD